MTPSIAFRLGAAALVVLTLPALHSAAVRCAGQEPRPAEGRPGALQRADDARRAADRKACARVVAAEVRAALRLLPDPDDAFQLLKTALDEIRNDPDLSVPCRERLQSHLEQALLGVGEIGPFIKRLGYERLALKADFRQRLNLWRDRLERWKSQLGLSPGRG
jgi:hypothetical protein